MCQSFVSGFKEGLGYNGLRAATGLRRFSRLSGVRGGIVRGIRGGLCVRLSARTVYGRVLGASGPRLGDYRRERVGW